MWEGKNQHLITWSNLEASGLQNLDLLSSIDFGLNYLRTQTRSLVENGGVGKKSLIIHSHKYVLSKAEVGLFFFFRQGMQMHFGVAVHALLIVSSNLLEKKKSFVLPSSFTIWGMSLAEEVKTRASNSNLIFQTVEERWLLLFHSKLLSANKTPA